MLNNSTLKYKINSITDTSIVMMFDKFCIEFIKIQKKIEFDEESNPQLIFQTLEAFIKSLIKKEIDTLSALDEQLKNAIYAITAFADEILLNMEWPGRHFWENHLLESVFFSTHISGDEIFRKIDELFEQGNILYVELAEVYLKMLAIGFKGRYRGTKDNKEIENYKQKLYKFITYSEPSYDIRSDKICVEAYSYTIEKLTKNFLPDPNKFWHLCSAFVFTFIIISSALWIVQTSELSKITEEIINVISIR